MVHRRVSSWCTVMPTSGVLTDVHRCAPPTPRWHCPQPPPSPPPSSWRQAVGKAPCPISSRALLVPSSRFTAYYSAQLAETLRRVLRSCPSCNPALRRPALVIDRPQPVAHAAVASQASAHPVGPRNLQLARSTPLGALPTTDPLPSQPVRHPRPQSSPRCKPSTSSRSPARDGLAPPGAEATALGAGCRTRRPPGRPWRPRPRRAPPPRRPASHRRSARRQGGATPGGSREGRAAAAIQGLLAARPTHRHQPTH